VLAPAEAVLSEMAAGRSAMTVAIESAAASVAIIAQRIRKETRLGKVLTTILPFVMGRQPSHLRPW
jgi:hypothetical protein